jgi:hypothetical protein
MAHTTAWIELGQLLVAGIGLPVLIWHVNGVHSSIKAQTLGCMYDHYFTICRTLLAKPLLRPYLYQGQRLASDAGPEVHAEVATVCELMTGLLEHAVVQRKNIPKDAWTNCWEPFLRHMYQDPNSELAEFYRKHRHFYAIDFQALVDKVLRDRAAPASAAPPASPSS